MIPYILAGLGGYLIGDSFTKKYNPLSNPYNILKDGGITKSKDGETKWIQKAIKKPGALRAEAKKQGLIKGDEKLSKADLDKLEKEGGKTAQRARLAKTLKKLD